jgi:hypothetical protein
MDWKRKTGIVVLIFIAVVVLLAIGVNFWVKHQLPVLINRQSESYTITYKDMDIDVLSGNVIATQVIIVPKNATESKIRKGIYATAQKLEIKQFKILSVLFSDRISARSLTLSKPEVILYKSNEKVIRNPESLKHNVVRPFEKVISVSDIYLYNGDLKIIYVKNKETLMSVSNINLQIDGIKITDSILKTKIPLGYENYSFSCDSLYCNASPFYDVRTKKIKSTKTTLEIDEVKYFSKYKRRQFISKLKTEKDLFAISAQKIKLQKLDWGYKDDILFVNVGTLSIDKCSADIYRNKLPPDDLTKKYLYNKLLRDLDFNLRVDTLRVRNSLLAYEEEKSFDKGSGKLIFDKFNLTATNIRSGFRQKKLPDLNINVDCRFMSASPMHVEWRLNVMDKSDGFNIRGTIRNVDSKRVNAFSKPYINATTEGTLNEVFFNFTGNDAKSHGEFAIKYDDFKVTFYQKKNREKKNKFLTAVGNLFVKNDTKGNVKGTKVEVERIPEKSFYNFFWRNIAEGLLKIFI